LNLWAKSSQIVVLPFHLETIVTVLNTDGKLTMQHGLDNLSFSIFSPVSKGEIEKNERGQSEKERGEKEIEERSADIAFANSCLPTTIAHTSTSVSVDWLSSINFEKI
jgi:hypothetical protein